MIVFGGGLERDWSQYPPWTYEETEHECPACGQHLTKVDVSSMLVCDEGHGPYFLV